MNPFRPTSSVRPEELINTHFPGPDTSPKIISRGDFPVLQQKHHIQIAGHTIARRGNCFVRLNPDFFQVLITCSGQGWALVESKWEPCPPGTVYVQPVGRLHAYFAEATQPWEFSWVIFDKGGPPWLESLALHHQPFLLQNDPALLSFPLQGLYNETTHRADPVLIEMWLQLIDANLHRLVETGSHNYGLSRMWRKVYQDLAHPWTLKAMAKIAGVSVETLRLLCHQRHGESPMQQVTLLRIRHVEALLATSDCSLETIVAETGYSDANALRRAFLRIKKETPARYRRRMRTAGRSI